MAILFGVALCVSAFIHPYILRIAKAKGIVDCPGERKLHKEPVPVTGGLVVFFGVVCSLCLFKTAVSSISLFPTVCAMMIMLYIGSIDDLVDLKAWIKILAELVVCTIVLFGMRQLMMNWQGLFGITLLPVPLAIPFTVIAMVGIINAMNLIDGVDGLSSGLAIFSFSAFSVFLFLAQEYGYCALAVICAGAMVPFFIHNVFGHSSKMYLGDGGALMVGVALATIVVDILKGQPLAYSGFLSEPERFSRGAMCLAVLSIPVFDTLRVMLVRIFHGVSPFHADKTHLHHHFISKGFSHLQTTLFEIGLNIAVVAAWLISYLLGAGITFQFWLVIGLSVLVSTIPVMVLEAVKTLMKNKINNDI